MVGVVVQPARPERREFTRIRLLTPFHGKVVGVHAPMLLKDISLGGFSVVSSIPFPVGAEHPFEFSLMGHGIVLTARVAHCTRSNPGGKPVHVVGFAFVRHQASDGDTIEALVQAVARSSLAVAHVREHYDLKGHSTTKLCHRAGGS
jgi:hypothetical protein